MLITYIFYSYNLVIMGLCQAIKCYHPFAHPLSSTDESATLHCALLIPPPPFVTNLPPPPPPPPPVDEEAAAAEQEDALFIRDRTVRQSSLSTGAVDGKKGKRRSGGLLKGLGSMFRSAVI